MQGSGAVGVDVRTEAREWTARAIFPSELPMEWSISAGEIIYNVRTALDHLAWQVVLRCGGQPTRQAGETASTVLGATSPEQCLTEVLPTG